MRVLFFDTETNGLPWNHNGSYLNTDNWPRILQIAWQIWYISQEEQAICLQQVNAHIKPDPSMKWDTSAAKIHKITLEDLHAKGKSIKTILNWFVKDCKEVDLIVAHNLKFDKMVLWAEAVRIDLDPPVWWPTQELCTMNTTTQICKIPGKNSTPKDPYKWPRLSEVFQFLWPERPLPNTLHDANTDVNCLVLCFRELLQRRLVSFPKICRERNRLVTALDSLIAPSNKVAS